MPACVTTVALNTTCNRCVWWICTGRESTPNFPGLNLTFETREGILKHCSHKNAHLLGELGERFLKQQQPGLEAQLANLADEVAYNNHDVDDGLRYGLVDIEQLRQIALFEQQYVEVIQRYPDISHRRQIHETIRRMINYMVVDLIETSRAALQAAGVDDIEAVRAQPQALLGYSPSVREQMLELKRFLRQALYAHYRVRRMSQKSAKIIQDLFQAFIDDPKLLPPQDQEKLAQVAAEPTEVARVVADYIAGMTDRYAIREHQRLFDPSALT